MPERKHRQLEGRREEVLSDIRLERSEFENMVQRAQIAGDPPDAAFVEGVRKRLAEIEQQATEATNAGELDRLVEHAQKQSRLRAYVCPRAELQNEGNLLIDLMAEWNVPKTLIASLRDLLGPELKRADTDPLAARGALRAILHECDSWESYTEKYEETMYRISRRLFGATTILLLLAILSFHFPQTLLVGLLLAGAAGSCVSVMARMPALDVAPSDDSDSYGRRTLGRIGIGVVASLIGCALLGWGLIPISIQNQTFGSLLNECSTSPPATCTGLKTLILLGVPMAFGFSERALTSFERRIFAK
jgi:hypothetical protein